MSNTAGVIWKCTGIGLTIGLMIGAVLWGWQMTPTSLPCVALHYTIEDAEERMYLTETELDQLLKTEDLYPVGRQVNSISLHRIEHAVARHPMVRSSECFVTPRNEVEVHLTQRVPLLRVQTMGESYIIDTDRRVMQARAAVRDSVPVVTGTVGVHMASHELADFAQWLQGDRYWRSRIRYLQVQSPNRVYLYLRGDAKPRALIGSLKGYREKLQKLRTFLENSAEITQDKQYYELDLRFNGQVIGRK